jgi:hypothetical protein
MASSISPHGIPSMRTKASCRWRRSSGISSSFRDTARSCCPIAAAVAAALADWGSPGTHRSGGRRLIGSTAPCARRAVALPAPPRSCSPTAVRSCTPLRARPASPSRSRAPPPPRSGRVRTSTACRSFVVSALCSLRFSHSSPYTWQSATRRRTRRMPLPERVDTEALAPEELPNLLRVWRRRSLRRCPNPRRKPPCRGRVRPTRGAQGVLEDEDRRP